jgi:hypothetical protein
MPLVDCPTCEPKYQGLFPDWRGIQPFRFYLAENLLEARAGSCFPTNGNGFDEDVNVYLFDLLKGLLRSDIDPRVTPGAGGLHHPPAAGLPRRSRAEWYRVNGDHRLLYLGLFDRGDGMRRKVVPFGFTADESRQRDLAAGAACYDLAADLLESRPGQPQGLVTVMRTLAADFEGYVHALGALAVRRWGLGARLSDDDLAALMDEAG